VFKRLGGALLLAVLAACTQPPPRPTPPPAAPPPARPPAANLVVLPAAGTYRIDPTRSELRVLVYRAGALAHLGHNHVIVNRSLQGAVRVATGLSETSVSIGIPVLEFIVDEAQARRQEGADFSADVPEDARSGTLHNLVSAAVLDAAVCPTITVAGSALSGADGALMATLTLRVAGRESVIDVPFTLQPGTGTDLTATGSFELRQTAIGLTPYSLMLGALQVQDALRIKFKITAAIS
jgi:hypothetical protein